MSRRRATCGRSAPTEQGSRSPGRVSVCSMRELRWPSATRMFDRQNKRVAEPQGHGLPAGRGRAGRCKPSVWHASCSIRSTARPASCCAPTIAARFWVCRPAGPAASLADGHLPRGPRRNMSRRGRIADRLRSRISKSNTAASTHEPDSSSGCSTAAAGEFDDEGRLTGIRGAIIDVSARISVERELRKAARLRSVVFEAARMAAWHFDVAVRPLHLHRRTAGASGNRPPPVRRHAPRTRKCHPPR